MDARYFERAHRDEQRRNEWKNLDEALRQRTGVAFQEPSLRVVLGQVLIQVGAKLMGEQVHVESTTREV